VVVVNLRRIVASLSQHRSSEPGEGSGFSGTAQGGLKSPFGEGKAQGGRPSRHATCRGTILRTDEPPLVLTAKLESTEAARKAVMER